MGLIFASGLSTRLRGGLSHGQAAARFCVAISTAGNWHRLWRATGSAKPGKQGQPSRSKLDAYEADIAGMAEDNKDIALYEIADRLAQEHGVRVAPSTVWHFFAKRGITVKKRRHMRQNKSATR